MFGGRFENPSSRANFDSFINSYLAVFQVIHVSVQGNQQRMRLTGSVREKNHLSLTLPLMRTKNCLNLKVKCVFICRK